MTIFKRKKTAIKLPQEPLFNDFKTNDKCHYQPIIMVPETILNILGGLL